MSLSSPLTHTNFILSSPDDPSFGVSIAMHIVSISEYLNPIMKAVLLIYTLVLFCFVKAHISWFVCHHNFKY